MSEGFKRDQFDVLLDVMERPPRMTKLPSNLRVDLRRFDGALVIGMAEDPHAGFLPGVTPRDVDNRPSVVAVRDDHSVTLASLRPVSRARARGQMLERHVGAPHIFEYEVAVLPIDRGDGITQRTFVRWVPGDQRRLDVIRANGVRVTGRFINVSQPRFEGDTAPRSSIDEGHELRLFSMLMAQFSDDLHWRVTFRSAPEGLGLGFWATPSRIAELFRLRDVPPGRTRRAALRHWVSGYQRRLSDVDEQAAAVDVRRHLRGATSFSFEGLHGHVSVSRSDLKSLEVGAHGGMR